MGLFDFMRDANNNSYFSAKAVFPEIVSECKRMGTDLVELVNNGPCCEFCAKYRRRIYSVSGRDKRFPLFPRDYRPGCCLSAYPFIYGAMEPSFKSRNIIQYSNRPFVDDRTRAEIKQYVDWKAMCDNMEQDERRKARNREDYAWLQANLPALCPKSISAYARMKNANSNGYQRIVEAARLLGRQLQ